MIDVRRIKINVMHFKKILEIRVLLNSFTEVLHIGNTVLTDECCFQQSCYAGLTYIFCCRFILHIKRYLRKDILGTGIFVQNMV